jgi:hypothetical protein
MMKRAQPDPPHPGDIERLNLTWLLAAREAAQSDADKAVLVFGLDQALSEVLCTASLSALRELAQCRLLLFRPRFPDHLLRACSNEAARSALGLALQSLLLAAEEVAPQ